MLVSPAYVHDRMLVCVHPDPQGVRIVSVTTTAGRTWRDAAMSGLVRPAGPLGADLTATISPSFATDHALFATTGSGTYVSTDLGATFRAVDTLTKPGAIDNPVPFEGQASTLPVGTPRSQPHVLLAYADSPLPAVIDPATATRRSVVGVPGEGALRFVVTQSNGAADEVLAVVNDPDAVGGDHAAVYRCDASLTCAQPLFSFPAGIRFGVASRMRVLPDRSLLATLADADSTPQVWRSTDGGVTFTAVRSVSAIIGALTRAGARPAVSFAVTAARPRRLYLRVESTMPPTGWKSGTPPASQLFRSDDDGTTWRLIAYGRRSSQPGKRGTLPWRLGPGTARQVQVTPDGRLFADGSSEVTSTTWCSIDGGVHWSPGCRA